MPARGASRISLALDEAGVEAFVQGGDPTPGAPFVGLRNDFFPQLGAFTYVVLRFDGNVVTLCSDAGDKMTCASESVPAPFEKAPEGAPFLGNPESGCGFSGALDEVAIYKRALSNERLQLRPQTARAARRLAPSP
ncbi:MAG: LamG domain-containing protein [Polyangiaceae bacterium]|nr:LamG domain-containing protein [Polyangiaceae bacterium]